MDKFENEEDKPSEPAMDFQVDEALFWAEFSFRAVHTKHSFNICTKQTNLEKFK
jgi:hypothetical protein